MSTDDGSAPSRRVAATALCAAQCVLGVALLARPDPVVRVVAGSGGTVPPRWVLRLLGGRLLVQGAGSLAVPSPAVATLGAGVDVVHALSMLGVAAVSQRYRRVALVNVVTAAASAVVSAPTAAMARDAGAGRGQATAGTHRR